MVQTYLYGYGNGSFGASTTRRTKDYIMSATQFTKVHPEHMRRLFGLADAVIAQGSDYGFGGGWRSSETQKTLFLSRYKRVSISTPTPGTIYWDGSPSWPELAGYYLHVSGASAAPPGKSYHESTTDNGLGFALAVDMVGDHTVGNKLGGAYGVINFSNVNSEPWHYQPIEIPHARSNYINQFENPVTWVLPGDPLPPPVIEEDMRPIEPVRVYDTRPGQFRPDGTPIPGGADGPFKSGEVRHIAVVYGKEAFIHVTTLNTIAAGYVAVSADGSFSGGTSLVNTQPGEVTHDGGPVSAPGGFIFVKASKTCDVIIDTYAQG